MEGAGAGGSGEEYEPVKLKTSGNTDLADFLKRISLKKAINYILDLLKENGIIIPLFNVIMIYADSMKKEITVYAKYHEVIIKYNGNAVKSIKVYGSRLRKVQPIKTIKVG